MGPKRVPEDKQIKKGRNFIGLGEIVDGRWEVVRALGEGGCGAVYEVKGSDGNQRQMRYAMKVEAKGLFGANLLPMERDVLRALRDVSTTHFCKYVTSGQTDRFRFVVMSMVGQSLGDLKRAVGHKHGRLSQFSLATSLFVGIETLKAIQQLHNIGYLHRDLKSSNMAIGRDPDTRRIIIIDFGLCRKYTNDHGKHRKPRDFVVFKGNLRCASPAPHLGEEQSRRDDLWAWLFILVDITVGQLPWDKLVLPADMPLYERIVKVGEAKLSSLAENGKALLEGCPREYQEAFNSIIKLGYYDDPTYNAIKGSLERCQQRKRYRPEDPLDWEPKGEYYDQMKAVPHATMMIDDHEREQMLQKSIRDCK